MKMLSMSLVLAGAIVAGCSAPELRSTPAPRGIWQDAGTPSTPPPPREMRYYRDEAGVLWDDRGQRVGGS